MQLLRLLPAFLAAGALAAPVAQLEERQDQPLVVGVVESDIGGIDKTVRHLTDDVNAYQGGALPAGPILVDVGAIHLVNRNAFVHALAPVQLDSADSGRVVRFTEQSVGVSIPQSVAATKAKKAQFDAAGLTFGIVAGLKLLENDHDTYSAELLKHVSPDWLARGQAVVDKIHNAIQDGVDYFST